MKQTAAILFSVILLMTNMQQVVFMVLYELNQDYITREYCINIDQPASCCKGKCHLEKTIASAEKEDTRNQNTRDFKLKELEIILQKGAALILSNCVSKKPDHSYVYSDHLLSGFSLSLIKPPVVSG